MITSSRPLPEIDGNGCTIRELLAGRKYSINYYQREYKWSHTKYAQRRRKGYEIEHIWADHSERHVEKFAHPSESAEHRNHIGGLQLLPKSFNANYGDPPCAEKRKHYLNQNLLACSLYVQAYDHNPGFRRLTRLPQLARDFVKFRCDHIHKYLFLLRPHSISLCSADLAY